MLFYIDGYVVDIKAYKNGRPDKDELCYFVNHILCWLIAEEERCSPTLADIHRRERQNVVRQINYINPTFFEDSVSIKALGKISFDEITPEYEKPRHKRK